MKKVCTVTFVNGNDVVSTQKVVEGDTVSKPADPARDGYTFVGWYADGAEAAYDFDAAVTGDMRLTAVYKQIPAKDEGTGSGSDNANLDTNADNPSKESKPSVLAKTADGIPLGAACAAFAVSALAVAVLSFRRIRS